VDTVGQLLSRRRRDIIKAGARAQNGSDHDVTTDVTVSWTDGAVARGTVTTTNVPGVLDRPLAVEPIDRSLSGQMKRRPLKDVGEFIITSSQSNVT